MTAINHHFANFAKIHGDTATDIRLYLPNPPIGFIGVTHKCAGFMQTIEIGH